MKIKNLFERMDNKKGIAGIEILIEIVIGIFILGVLIFCITLMGSEITEQDSFWNEIPGVLTNSTTTSINDSGLGYPTGLTPGFRNCQLTVTQAENSTGAHTSADIIPTTNYSVTGCYITWIGGSGTGYWNNSLWNITGTWTYDQPDDSIRIINDTYHTIGETSDWFSIIIIFGAIVVLILLTVLIIRTIRGSGLAGNIGYGNSRETA